MSTFRFIPNAEIPPIAINPDILGIAITACDAKSTRFIPIGYSLAVDGPFKLKRRRCKIQFEVGHRLHGITVKERSVVARNF